MMGITARSDVGFDPTPGTRSQGGRTKIASVQRRRLRRADCRRDGLEDRFGFLAIVRVVGEGISHDEQTGLIYGNLCVVILLKTSIRRVIHHARLWVGEVILVPVTRPWYRRRRWTATRATPRRALPLRTLCHLGFIVGLLSCRPLLGAGLDHRFGFRQPRQAVLPSRDLLMHHQPISHLWLLALLGSDEEFFDLGSKLELQLQQTLVTDGVMLGGIGMELGPVQADRAQFQHTRLLSEQEDLYEEILQFWQESAPKRGERIVVRMEIAGNEAKWHGLIGGTLNLARTEHSCRIAIEQQAQQHFGGVGFPTARPIAGIQSREVKQGHTVHHETGQMVRWQTVTQAYCQIQCLVIIHSFECSFHAHSLPLLTSWRLLLSDKLLARKFLLRRLLTS